MSDREKGEYAATATSDNDIKSATFRRPAATSTGPSVLDDIINHPALPVVAYCVSSILMTVVNKFVVSGRDFNMNFLLLGIQSFVCVAVVLTFKRMGTISFREFNADDARKWFPISSLLVAVIYTGSKSLQFLSTPVYTIFKNLTIILIAYGEVLWFGGHVTALTLVSFGMMIASSVVAAWTDVANALAAMSSSTTVSVLDPATGADVPIAPAGDVMATFSALNAGYLWMLVNCLASAAYVLTMRKRIKVTGFKDWDSMFYNNLLSIPVLVICSFLIENWHSSNLELNFPPEGRSFFLFAIAFSGAAAVLISYNTAWCLRATSSTTYSMVGALNKLPVAASGMIFFGDPVTAGSVSAISLGFIAGLVYAVAKNNQSKAQKMQGPSIIPMSASSAAIRDANGPK